MLIKYQYLHLVTIKVHQTYFPRKNSKEFSLTMWGISPTKCWNIVSWTHRNTLQWNVNRNSYIFIIEDPFENVVWKKSAILSLPQCVKYYEVMATFPEWPLLISEPWHMWSSTSHFDSQFVLFPSGCPGPTEFIATSLTYWSFCRTDAQSWNTRMGVHGISTSWLHKYDNAG